LPSPKLKVLAFVEFVPYPPITTKVDQPAEITHVLPAATPTHAIARDHSGVAWRRIRRRESIRHFPDELLSIV
jgi:hypothetical protein